MAKRKAKAQQAPPFPDTLIVRREETEEHGRTVVDFYAAELPSEVGEEHNGEVVAVYRRIETKVFTCEKRLD